MKKITKKLLTCVSSCCISVFSVVPTMGNAILCIGEANDSLFDYYDNDESYVKLDKKYNSLFHYYEGTLEGFSDKAIENATIYYNGAGFVELIEYETNVHTLASLTEGTTLEQVNDFLKENFNKYYCLSSSILGTKDYPYVVSEKVLKSKEAVKLLKENNLIDGMVIPNRYVQKIECGAGYNTEDGIYAISYSHYWFLPWDIENLENYLDETGIAEIKHYDDYQNDAYVLIPPEDSTIEEYLDIVMQIKEDTGMRPFFSYPESANVSSAGYSVDVFNSIEGDANGDGMMNIADATAIVQYVANPDKYMLSAQGQYNADFDCDGITALDALTIQKALVQK